MMTERKSQSRVNPPELLPLAYASGREAERLKLIYGIVGGRRPLTEDEAREVARLTRAMSGEEAQTKRPDYSLDDFEKEFPS